MGETVSCVVIKRLSRTSEEWHERAKALVDGIINPFYTHITYQEGPITKV